MSHLSKPDRGKPKPNWYMMVCCNDPDSGHFAGEAEAFGFELGDYGLTVEGGRMVVEFQKGLIILNRHPFACSSVREWVGNWCWNGMQIPLNSFLGICKLLKQEGFSPTNGCTELWEWWETL